MAIIAVMLASGAGCSRSPEAKKARYLERGDKYFAQKQYREALIEYQNALRIDRNNARAIERAGAAYYELGELAQAFPYLVKYRELDPTNVDVRLKLGMIRLMARQPDQVREEADFILEGDPKNVGALMLLAGVATTAKDQDLVIRRLEEARDKFGDRAR